MSNHIKISNELFENVMLAPMCGITDYPFRKIVCSFGKCITFSEMIASHEAIYKWKSAAKKLKIDKDITNCMQISSNDPKLASEAAKIAEDNGVELIDINFGCPVKKVVNGMAGSAMMKDVPLAAKIIRGVVNSVKIPVSIKTRLGWNEDNLNCMEFCKMAQNEGSCRVTIHARTRSQMFSGKAKWSSVKQVANLLEIPVIINGDIVDYETFNTAVNESGASGAMIGRGAWGRPWIVENIIRQKNNIKPIEISNKLILNTLLKHLDFMEEHYGEFAYRFARKHIGFYSKSIPNSSFFRNEINKIKDILQMKRLAINLLDY